MLSRYNLHPRDSYICGKCGSQSFRFEEGKVGFIFTFPFINLIDLNDFFDEDACLLVSFDINVFSSFFTLVLDVYPMEDMSSNLN
jgi:hypothetical protein